MRMEAKAAEEAAVLRTAQAMCAAIRTAPKARGIDELQTLILTEKEKDDLADEMDRVGDSLGAGFFHRDAGNVRAAQAVVLVGVSAKKRGLNEMCQLCNHHNCAQCEEKNGICIYDPMDLGIALGSAAAVAAREHIDNRILFSAGKAALAAGYFGDEITIIMGIPLAAAGKNPFFDRK